MFRKLKSFNFAFIFMFYKRKNKLIYHGWLEITWIGQEIKFREKYKIIMEKAEEKSRSRSAFKMHMWVYLGQNYSKYASWQWYKKCCNINSSIRVAWMLNVNLNDWVNVFSSVSVDCLFPFESITCSNIRVFFMKCFEICVVRCSKFSTRCWWCQMLILFTTNKSVNYRIVHYKFAIRLFGIVFIYLKNFFHHLNGFPLLIQFSFIGCWKYKKQCKFITVQ